eukprot:6205520-Pleurochrysis_carterae.AAC.2
MGFECDTFDNDQAWGGEILITCSATRCAAGEFVAVAASPPYFAFSVSRHFRSAASPDGGPSVVRSHEHPLALPDVLEARRRELADANELVRHTTVLLFVARDVGAEYILEHPADSANARVAWLSGAWQNTTSSGCSSL